MGSVFVACVTFVHANLCLHTFTTRSLGWEGVGDYLKYSPAAAKILLLCCENVWKDLKKQYTLKMYINMKYQFTLHDKNIVRVTSNQPPIPCFKPHKT